MQFLQIKESTTLAELSDRVGDRNVDSILNMNYLKRSVNIGKQFKDVCINAVSSYPGNSVDWQTHQNMLNQLTEYADVFETVALLGQEGLKLFYMLGTFSNMLRLPESIILPDATDILGVKGGVKSTVYKKSMQALENNPHYIDPAIFNEYSSIKGSNIINRDGDMKKSADPSQWFNIPWGDITLYSSLGGDSKDIPVYPEELSDKRGANYSTMPDMLYQYEPWQVYESSGPRSNTYTFHFHRDMWSGDHRDGKANELIRFCEANCYPEFNGSAVNTSIVTLYIVGKPVIRGVLTDVSVRWSGPIGLDGWYLDCEMELSITEVSETPLNYSTVRNKGLIG